MRNTKELSRKKQNTNKGITLIALVITIIVMLILVAVTITMAVNGGLFNYAGKAATQTNKAIEKEQELANLEANMTVNQLIDKYTNGEIEFQIDGVAYRCVEGMTWEEWIESDYYDQNLGLSASKYNLGGGYYKAVCILHEICWYDECFTHYILEEENNRDSAVRAEDVIQKGHNYDLYELDERDWRCMASSS